MARTLLCKLLQKKTYDILSQKNTFIFLFIGIVIVLVSALHFGETMLEWSKEKYSSVFNPYSDNIAGKNFRKMLCQYVPIDVVYTWVNGTDPKFLKGLAHAREEYGFTSSHTNSCSLSQCVRSHMALVKPQLPNAVTLSDLEEADSAFEDISGIFIVGSPYDNHQNITVLIFPSIEIANHVVEKNTFTLQGQNYTISTAYITDNWMSQNTILLKDIFMMTQVPSGYSEEQIIEKLPVSVKEAILKVFLHEEKSLAVLTVGDRQALDTIMKLDNISFENKVASITAANLVVELPSGHEDISASRFTDNEELRYSLRSLEKHAPWVQHIYIVTNGQIPHWLNLDNPRVTIVTHEEIFPNKSHLPTFSSPSIECHLHRIPNLSKKFLYLNDDVMFGKDIWPEDFYTHMKGQKVYLSWPVPNCAEGCPSSWIRDGYCDKPCNNSQCQWDGGDCSGDNPLLPYQSGVIHQEGSISSFYQAGTEKSYCNQDCANSWLADRYCDKACNTIKCAFDAGDCGTENYNQLYKLTLSDIQHEYHMPQGETIGFFNLTEFISHNYTVTEGFYDDHPVVRSLAISLKYSVLTVVLHSGHNTTNLTVTLKGEKLKQPFERIFYLIVNTKKEIKPEIENSKLETGTTNLTEIEEPLIFEEFPDDLRFPKVLIKEVEDEKYLQFSNVNVNASQLPVKVVQLIEDLDAQYKRDELSEKGYVKKKSEIIYNYIASLKPQNIPLLVYETGQKILPNITYTRTSSTSALISNLLPVSRKNNLHFPLSSENDKLNVSVQNQSQHSSHIELVKNITEKQALKVLKINGKGNEELSKNLKLFHLQDVINNPNVHLQEKPSPSLRAYVEKLGNVSSKKNDTIKQFSYETSSVKQRHLLDTFGDSLRHVNKLYNDAFGYEARKVPSHIAHLVDVDVMTRLASRFSHAVDVTSSHKIRSSDDMQFAFSYYYFLMSEMESVDLREVFDVFDTDHSGTWSDREIRTVLTRLHDLPLDFTAVHEFEENIINCSASFPELHKSFSTPLYERYYDSKLPTVTKTLILGCAPVANMLLQQFGSRKRNKYEAVGEEEVAFKMIHNNLSQVLGQIDDIRKNPRKFVCLNDNMNHGTKEAEVIRAVIQDFYESLFPIRSQFELPPEYRNRFLYVEELRDWRRLRDIIRIATYVCLGLLIIFSATSFWKAEVRPSNRSMGSRPSRQHNRNSYQV